MLTVLLLFSFLKASNFCHSPVLVATIDSTYDIEHFAIKPSLWTNSGEIPGNKIDDDNNGFIDDLHGWDPADNDGDITFDFNQFHCDDICKKFAQLRFKMRAGLATPEEITTLEEIQKNRPNILSDFSNYISIFHGTSVTDILVRNTSCVKWVGLKHTQDRFLISTPEKNYSLKGERPSATELVKLEEIVLELRLQRFLPARDYIKKNNIRVVTCSFFFDYSVFSSRYDYELKERFNYKMTEEELNAIGKRLFARFQKIANSIFTENPNTLFIFATTNNGKNIDLENYFPQHSKFDNTLTVQASHGFQKPALFTGFGSKSVDFAIDSVNIFYAVPGNIFLLGSATSLSAPAAGNVAAKILEVNNSLSTQSLKKIMLQSIRKSEAFKNFNSTSGVLDGQKALDLAKHSN